MTLNKEAYEELRVIIEDELENVHDDKKIKLDKDLLDRLLFETIEYNNKKIKLPIWSGPFLKKLDLSEVDFEDVSWSTLGDDNWMYGSTYEFLTTDNVINKINKIKEKHKAVNYNNTNVLIDFTKSWECKETNGFAIAHCDFSNVDLSNNDMSKLRYIYDSNLSNTKLVLEGSMFKSKKEKYFKSVNLQNVDLSLFNIDGSDFLIGSSIFSNDCVLSNTGINITIDRNDSFWYDDNNLLKDRLKVMIDNGSLNETYINGKKVLSKEENMELANKELKKYNNMKNEIFNSITNSIEKQRIYGKTSN